MGSKFACYLIKPSDQVHIYLRRYIGGDYNCLGPTKYHTATKLIAQELAKPLRDGYVSYNDYENHVARDDKRWPTKCDHCDYVFKPDDPWQVMPDLLWRSESGTLMSKREAPPGCMWFGAGIYANDLYVRTPGGDWNIDDRASNCTMKDDKVHKCWVRHGEPPNITVDKNGVTCGAGAGSILINDYHGFLKNGFLVEDLNDAV